MAKAHGVSKERLIQLFVHTFDGINFISMYFFSLSLILYVAYKLYTFFFFFP